MVKTTDMTLSRDKICEYIWAVYIDQLKAPFDLDEEAALHWFERWYSKHPLNDDEECFYYGILLYERAFSDDVNRDRYIVKAKEVPSDVVGRLDCASLEREVGVRMAVMMPEPDARCMM